MHWFMQVNDKCAATELATVSDLAIIDEIQQMFRSGVLSIILVQPLHRSRCSLLHIIALHHLSSHVPQRVCQQVRASYRHDMGITGGFGKDLSWENTILCAHLFAVGSILIGGLVSAAGVLTGTFNLVLFLPVI